MKFTICGYNQTVLIEHNLTLDDVFILKVISDIYFSQSEKINSIIFENCKYIWLSYKYIHKEIPIIGTERTLINRINSLVKKGFLKKLLRTQKTERQESFYTLQWEKIILSSQGRIKLKKLMKEFHHIR